MRWLLLVLSLIFSGNTVADSQTLHQQSLALADRILSAEDAEDALAYTRLIPFLLSEELRATLLDAKKITLLGDDPLLRWSLQWCPDERSCQLTLTFRDEVTVAPVAEELPDIAELWRRWGQKLAQKKGWTEFAETIKTYAQQDTLIDRIVPSGAELVVVIVEGYLDPEKDRTTANDAAWSDDVFNSKITSALFQGVFGLKPIGGNENRLSGQISASDGTSRKFSVFIEHSGIPAPWNIEKQRLQSARAYDLFTWGMATSDIVIYNGHSRYGRYLDFGSRDDEQNPYKFHVGSLLFNLPMIFYPDIAKMKFRSERPQALIHLGCDSQALYQKRLEDITANTNTAVFTLPGDIQQNDGSMMSLLFVYGLLNKVKEYDLKRIVLEAQFKPLR